MLVAISGTKYSCVELAINIFVKKHRFELIDDEKEPDNVILDYCTKNYTRNMVIKCDRLSLLETLSKRPFFVHLSIDASINFRLEYQKKTCTRLNDSFDMGIFLQALDDHDFQADAIELRERSDFKFKIINSDVSSIDKRLEEAIAANVKILENSASFNKISPPLRPDWDSYFMKLATLAASRANCMKRRVGCVIVRDYRVIATGYNGTPRHLKNCFNGGCPRCNDGNSKNLETCLCLHAEENALLEAGRDRVGPNAILYCDTCPCLTCSVKIVQIGIKEVVYSQNYSMDAHSFKVLKEGGVHIRQFSFAKEPRIVLI
ncbi:hypothetical protein TBLA_0B00860 [Henningerozyma blattae CBS 6284]|uniref:Deoxycytidylate deaminase n=1 Tax=Henningerozyma blattae (strain ATCC 34711 / CBS 6284 / DSM 70876 / NBRC 10599 / NRRL Y-10934 / UCD 77-7) TaxID=1071380 RepID=I2GXS7_HENB6|nr:hypothetical protein TBLA_0B00860 [Tetrapisispora blattae CBS 6284]CCH58929.1 hypothetical protein TBLA_0B00860 [Tetrapisispora blattae CBS 6284]